MPSLSVIVILTGCILTSIIIRYLLRARRPNLTNSPPHVSQGGEKSLSHFTCTAPPLAGQPLPQPILQTDASSIDRGDWVRRLTNHVFADRHVQRYNVLTIHTNIDYQFSPSGVIERVSVEYQGAAKARIIPYDVIVFERGHLVNLGDGGYINWCFEGNFQREDESVIFTEIARGR